MPTAAFENPVSVNFTVKSNHDLSRLQDLVGQLDPKRSELGYQSTDIKVGDEKYLVRVQGEKAEIFAATGNEHMEVAKIRIRKNETPEVNTNMRSAERITEYYKATVTDIIDALTTKANKTAFAELYSAVRSNDPKFDATLKGQKTSQTYNIETEDYGSVSVKLGKGGALHLTTAKDSFVLNTDGTQSNQPVLLEGKLQKRGFLEQIPTSDGLISAIKRTLSDKASLQEASLPSVTSAPATAPSETTQTSETSKASVAQEITAAPSAEMQKLFDLAQRVLEKGQTSDAVRFTNAEGEPMTLTKNTDGSFSFQPPTGSPVKITATGIEGSLSAETVENLLRDSQSHQAFITVATPKAVSAADAEVTAEAATATRINFKHAVLSHITNITSLVESLGLKENTEGYRSVSVSIENPPSKFPQNSSFSFETKGSITYINDAQGSTLMRIENGKITTPSSPTITATEWNKLLADICESLTPKKLVPEVKAEEAATAPRINFKEAVQLHIAKINGLVESLGLKENTEGYRSVSVSIEKPPSKFPQYSSFSVETNGSITYINEAQGSTLMRVENGKITTSSSPTITATEWNNLLADITASLNNKKLELEASMSLALLPAVAKQGAIIDPAAVAPVAEVAAPEPTPDAINTPSTPAAEPDLSLKAKIAGLMVQVLRQVLRLQSSYDEAFSITIPVSGEQTTFKCAFVDGKKLTVLNQGNGVVYPLTLENTTIHGVPSESFLEAALEDLRKRPSAISQAPRDPEETLPGGNVVVATEPKASKSTPPALPIDVVASDVEAAQETRGFLARAKEWAKKTWNRFF